MADTDEAFEYETISSCFNSSWGFGQNQRKQHHQLWIRGTEHYEWARVQKFGLRISGKMVKAARSCQELRLNLRVLALSINFPDQELTTEKHRTFLGPLLKVRMHPFSTGRRISNESISVV